MRGATAEDVRNALTDLLLVNVEFLESVFSGLHGRVDLPDNPKLALNYFNKVLVSRNRLLSMVMAFLEDYSRLVYETRRLIVVLLGIMGVGDVASLDGDVAFDPAFHLKGCLEAAKGFLRELMTESFLKFDELVNVVWGRVIEVSLLLNGFDSEMAAGLQRVINDEIKKWEVDGGRILDSYNNALAAEDEECFVNSLLTITSGARDLLAELAEIGAAFSLKPDLTGCSMELLLEIMDAISVVKPVFMDGLNARSTVNQYAANTLLQIFRTAYGSDSKGAEMLGWFIVETFKLKGRMIVHEALPESLPLEDVRVGLIIARANIEDSLKELKKLEKLVESLSRLFTLVDFPILREFYEAESVRVKHAESIATQMLNIIKDTNVKIYSVIRRMKEEGKGKSVK
nr:hypothetical protein [Candidatus Freyrarchaeum guaymaensis]